MGHTNKVSEVLSIFFCNFAFFYKLWKIWSEGKFSVMLPNSSEMWFSCHEGFLFMRVFNIIFAKHFWSHLNKSVPFFFEVLFTFSSCCVNTKSEMWVLVCISERVEFFISVIKMTLVVSPSRIGYFIIEKSWWSSFTPLFNSKQSNNVRFKSLSYELLWSPFWFHIF